MEYEIRLGIPEMKEFWDDLTLKINNKSATKEEKILHKKLSKCFTSLKKDPRYPSLHSHEISELTSRYGVKVFESYLENHTFVAGRIFWVYGPFKQCITVIA